MEKLDKDINKVIEEMMGFSPSSDKLGNDILKYIEGEVKAGNILRHEEDEDDESKIYTLANHIQIFKTEGEANLYELRIIIRNYPAEMPETEVYKKAEEFGEASCMLSMDNKKNAAFVIEGTLVYQDWELHKYNKGVFHHEIKHAYTNIRTLEDSDVEEYMNRTGVVASRSIYAAANKISNNPLIRMMMSNVGAMAATVYVSDKHEISSFTQQAFKDLEDAKSFSDVDSMIKNTMLYKYSNFLNRITDELEDPESNDTYNSFVEFMALELPDDVKMPTKEAYLKMLRKRCKKYVENVGKVIVYTKDKLREEAIKEGYRVPLVIYDGSWANAYKLGNY